MTLIGITFYWLFLFSSSLLIAQIPTIITIFLSKRKSGLSGTPMTSAKHPSSYKLVTRRSKCLHKRQVSSTFFWTQRTCLNTSQTTKKRFLKWEKSRIRKGCQRLLTWWGWMWFMNTAVFGWTSLRSWLTTSTG